MHLSCRPITYTLLLFLISVSLSRPTPRRIQPERLRLSTRLLGNLPSSSHRDSQIPEFSRPHPFLTNPSPVKTSPKERRSIDVVSETGLDQGRTSVDIEIGMSGFLGTIQMKEKFARPPPIRRLMMAK